jgi:hypothetical protein
VLPFNQVGLSVAVQPVRVKCCFQPGWVKCCQEKDLEELIVSGRKKRRFSTRLDEGLPGKVPGEVILVHLSYRFFLRAGAESRALPGTVQWSEHPLLPALCREGSQHRDPHCSGK